MFAAAAPSDWRQSRRPTPDGTAHGVGDHGGIYRLRLADAIATKISQLTVP